MKLEIISSSGRSVGRGGGGRGQGPPNSSAVGNLARFVMYHQPEVESVMVDYQPPQIVRRSFTGDRRRKLLVVVCLLLQDARRSCTSRPGYDKREARYVTKFQHL